ncbi:MAG TPA: GNAT family N-acetyltransferase [Terriglobales bacterium]|nr:GNAT family N-acetyltransferase [Terriglobales bacterium]
MPLSLTLATAADAEALSALHSAVAEHLTRLHGPGHWSMAATQRGALNSLRHAQVLVAFENGALVGTLRLASKKPWAIDVAYFSDVRRPLYLTSMAVAPGRQRQGVGRLLLEHARTMARGWPADSLRLDAYDGPAGAGGFYSKCGFREVGRVIYRMTPLVYFEQLL